MTSFVLQIVIMAGVLSVVVILLVQKKASKTPYEITYKHQLMESALYHSPNAIVVTDVQNKILIWNYGAEKLFGYKEDEVKGKDLSLIRITLPEVILKDTPVDTEAWHRLQSAIPVSLTVSEAKVGTVTHYTAIMKGIRERKEKERLIEREMELLNHSERANRCGSSSWDTETNRIMITDGGNRIFELDDLISDAETLQRRIYFEDKEKVRAAFLKAVETKQPYTYRYRIQHGDGRIIWVESRGEIIVRANGTLERVLTFIKEVEGDYA